MASRWARWHGPAIVMAIFLVYYAHGTATARSVLRAHDRQPTRQTVAYVRDNFPQAITGTFGVSDRQHAFYDPGVRVLNTVAEVDGLIGLAKERGAPLCVYFCSDEHAAKRNLALYERVVRSGDFTRVAVFPGTEELFSYRVYHYKGTAGDS
ncbi:MAG: hypothetical protein ACOYMN_26270, partial [Roseimicrobium sp.]